MKLPLQRTMPARWDIPNYCPHVNLVIWGLSRNVTVAASQLNFEKNKQSD